MRGCHDPVPSQLAEWGEKACFHLHVWKNNKGPQVPLEMKVPWKLSHSGLLSSDQGCWPLPPCWKTILTPKWITAITGRQIRSHIQTGDSNCRWLNLGLHFFSPIDSMGYSGLGNTEQPLSGNEPSLCYQSKAPKVGYLVLNSWLISLHKKDK